MILHEEGRATAATRSWKRSPDPDFSAKAARLRRLYRQAETGRLDGVLVCFDEHGPVTPTPKHGRSWARLKRPRRLPANYRKPHGVAFFFGCYDVGADQLFGRWFRRKGADHVMTTLRMIRATLPRRAHLGRPGQLVVPLHERGAGPGLSPRHRLGAHPHLRQLAEPHRVPLRGHGEGRLRRLELHRPRRDPGRLLGLAPAAQRRGET